MARVEWDAIRLKKDVDLAVATATERGAEYIAKRMRKNAERDKEMVSAIGVKESQYKNGGHIAGVFSVQSGKWQDSLAARAIYQDYGHAKPYHGRGNKKRSQIVKHVPGNHFIRKALRAGRRIIPKYFEGALKH